LNSGVKNMRSCTVSKVVFPRTGSDSFFMPQSFFFLCRGFSCFYCMFRVAMLLQWKLIWRRHFIARSIFELCKYQFSFQTLTAFFSKQHYFSLVLPR